MTLAILTGTVLGTIVAAFLVVTVRRRRRNDDAVTMDDLATWFKQKS